MNIQQGTTAVNFTFFGDTGHGWLQVPHSFIWELDLQDRISTYSYVDEAYAYLEEDCDYAALRVAMDEKGLSLSLKEVLTNSESPIRRKRSYDPSYVQKPTALVDLTVSVEFSVVDEGGVSRSAQDTFNWTLAADNCRLELAERLADEVERQAAHGWLRGKTFDAVKVISVTRNMPDGRYLDFPVVVSATRQN
ncbi:TPA: hypothetical protein L6A81_35065 [Pseudomonas aeruginosa]|nr:hypothetical protein [Pseudomonas aeruginosa]